MVYQEHTIRQYRKDATLTGKKDMATLKKNLELKMGR
jgi:hypothetical protein